MRKVTYSTGTNSHPQQVYVTDFNKDNQSDIAVVNAWNNKLRVFLISNNGTKATFTDYSTGIRSSPNALAVGDFNKDGWSDIVVVNKDIDNMGIFLGYDYPTFKGQITRIKERNSNPTFIVVNDFNNDSLWDVAVACFKKNYVGIFLGYGNGTLATETINPLPEPSNPVALTVSDFNNDDILDIAVANLRGKTISILLGYGNGTFAPEISMSTTNSSPVSIAVGDFNKDKIQDLVVAFKKENYIGVFLGYGNGSFIDPITYNMPNGSAPVSVVVNDVNHDNIQDIAVTNFNRGNIGILLGFGNGTFDGVRIYSTGNGSGPGSMTMADFNKDNIIDIAVANLLDNSVAILLGYGNGTFILQAKYKVEPFSDLNSIVVADLNNDAVLDIVLSDWGSTRVNIGIFYGLGNGTFLVAKGYSTGVNTKISSIAIADFDNDGRNDIVTSSSNKNHICIFLRYQSEPFGEQTLFNTGTNSQPYSVAVNDFNNDNRLDIVVANSIANTIGIFLGYGNGSFTTQYQYSLVSGSVPKFIATADFNNDKQIDIVVANSNKGTICIFYGNGNGNFTLSGCYSTGTGSEPSSIAVADLNRDNQTDIVVTNRGINTVLVFYNYENGKLSNPKSYSLGYDARPVSVAIGDFDNNTLLDIVATNNKWSYINILLLDCIYSIL